MNITDTIIYLIAKLGLFSCQQKITIPAFKIQIVNVLDSTDADFPIHTTFLKEGLARIVAKGVIAEAL